MTLTTTGTFDFAPSVGEVVLNALSRIQIRGPMVKAEMLQMANSEANLMQVEWSNRGPNLWTVDEQTVDTVPGYATYPVDPSTISVLEVTLGQGVAPYGPRILLTSISRTSYMAYPNKLTPGPSTTYWYDMLVAPTITLWPVPNGILSTTSTSLATASKWTPRCARRAMRKRPIGGSTPCVAGLAARLATHYAPALEQRRAWRRPNGRTNSPPTGTQKTHRSICRR